MAAPIQELIKVKDWNAYVHLPSDYAQNTERFYPTIIFIPGLGEVGTDANKLIANGPGAYLNQGWDGNALGVKFIVISLQPPGQWPRPWDVKTRIDELKKLYRIGDMYLTGLSMGGWASLWYAYYYPDEVKKVVGVESVVPVDGPEQEQSSFDATYRVAALAGQRFLIFEQKNDYRRNDMVCAAMNKAAAGSAVYINTNFGSGGHCCWNEFYGGQGKQPGRFNIDRSSLNIYEWMAGSFVLPDFITKAALEGNELSWHCENTEEGDYFLIEKTTDFVKFEIVERIPATGNDFKIKV